MAVAAVFLSMPLALFTTLYLCLLGELAPAEGLAVYALVGLAFMSFFTLGQLVRSNEAS